MRHLIILIFMLLATTIRIYDENNNLSGYVRDNGGDYLKIYDKNWAYKGVLKRTDSTFRYYDADNRYGGMIRKDRLYDQNNKFKGYLRDNKLYDRNNRYQGYHR